LLFDERWDLVRRHLGIPMPLWIDDQNGTLHAHPEAMDLGPKAGLGGIAQAEVASF
jgi:hypothetical protein